MYDAVPVATMKSEELISYLGGGVTVSLKS